MGFITSRPQSVGKMNGKPWLRGSQSLSTAQLLTKHGFRCESAPRASTMISAPAPHLGDLIYSDVAGPDLAGAPGAAVSARPASSRDGSRSDLGDPPHPDGWLPLRNQPSDTCQ